MTFLQFIMSNLRISHFKIYNSNGSGKVNVKNFRSFSTSPLLLSDSETGNTNVSQNNLDHVNQETQDVSMERSVSEGSSQSGNNSDSQFSDSEDEDIEESAKELAETYNQDMKSLMDDQASKMEKVAEKSEEYITTFINERSKDREDVKTSELGDYDLDTKEEVNRQRDLCIDKVSRIAAIRDTALDSMDSLERDYGSDYDSDTDGHNAQYNRLDQSTVNLKQSYNTAVDNLITSVDQESSRTQSLTENLQNQNENSDSVSVEQGSSKRKREESEETSDSKRIKTEDSSDKSVASDKDTRSPLAYVIDQQHEAGHD